MATMVRGLTNAGHDLIAESRRPGAWDEAKRMAGELGIGVVANVLHAIVLRSLGPPPR